MIRKNRIKNDEQGVALILVLGIMAVMIGIALTFASSMRLTEKTAKNYYYSMQAMYSARAGMHHAIHYLKNDVRPNLAGPANDSSMALDTMDAISDHLNELWNTEFIGSDVYLEQNYSHPDAVGSRWIVLTTPQTVDLGNHIYSRYAVLVKDEAGKVNFNVASNYAVANIKQGHSTAELSMAKPFEHDSFTNAMVNAIIDYRYGPDNEPGLSGEDDNKNNDGVNGALNDGVDNNPAVAIDAATEGVDEPSEFCPYDPLFSDDRPFHSIDDIQSSKVNSGITPTIFQAIEDDITVFSRERQQYLDSTSAWNNKLSLNFPPPFPALSTILLNRGIPDNTIKALRLIDYADSDPIPTYINDSAYGIEGLSVSEVMARPYKWYTTMCNDPFDETVTGDWAWDSGDNKITTTGAVNAATPTAGIDIVRKGRYNIYVESYDDSDAMVNNSFTIEIRDDLAGSSNDYVTGAHNAGDFAWEHLGTFTFTGNNPADNRITLTKTGAGGTQSSLRQILFSQEGDIPGGTITDDADYVEIRNISRRPIDIAGWTLSITYSNSEVTNFTIPTIPVGNSSRYYTTKVPAGGFLCIVRDAATNGIADNTGLTANVVPGTAEFTADTINFEQTWGTDGSGTWGDDGDVVENFPILPIAGFGLFSDVEADLITLVADQGYNNPWNAAGVADRFSYTTLPLDNMSKERVSPFFWENHDFNATDTDGGSPGRAYTGDHLTASAVYTGNPFKDTDWAIKDGPLSSLGEILDIIYSYDSASNTVLTVPNTDLIKVADMATVNFLKLEAEDVVDAPVGTMTNGASPYGSSSRYMFPDSGSMPVTFLWTSGSLDDVGADDINYIFRGYYDLFVCGEPGNTVTVTVPSHANDVLSHFVDVGTIDVTPGASGLAHVGRIKTAPDLLAYDEASLKIDVSDALATAGNSYFDYVVVTPGVPPQGKINLNTATKEKILSALPGISDIQASNIIANRPYQTHADFLNEVASNSGSLKSSITLDEYRLISNLIVFNSDVFEIIVRGQVYYENAGVVKVLGEQVIQAVIDREEYRKDDDQDGDPDGPVRTLYYRLLK